MRKHVRARALVLGAAAVVLTAGVAAVAAVSAGGPSSAGAADHLDAPNLTPPGGNLQTDITDIYAFRAPNGRTVLVMNVNGLTAAGKQATFARNVPSVAGNRRVTYNLRVDNNGDAREDVTLAVTFGTPNGAGVQELTVKRNGRQILDGSTSPFGRVVRNNGSGIRAYAGMRDDPFFFDLDGFINILSKTPGESFLGCR